MRVGARSAAIAATLCGLGMLAAPAAAASYWLAPITLSATGQSAEQPLVALDAAGDATAIWRRYDGSKFVIQAASRQAGGDWEAPVTLSAPGQNAFAPQLALDAAGDAVAVWSRFNGAETGTNSIIQAASRPAGGAWGAAVDLSAVARNADDPQVVLDDSGNATAIWRRYDGSDFIAETASRPAGGAWDTPAPLSAPGESAEELQLDGDGAGDATAVWRRRNGADFIVEAAGRPAGGSWGSATGVSPSGQDADQPQVGLDAAGDATAVWRRHAGADFIVESARSAAGGGWGPPTELSTPGGTAQVPRLAVDPAGDAIAIWTRASGLTTVVQVAGRPSGGAWESALDLTTPVKGGPTVDAARVAIGPLGDAVAVWTSTNASPTLVFSSTRPGVAGPWASAQPVSVLGNSAIEPEVAVDPAGDAIAIWSRYDGSKNVIQAAALDGAPPQLRSLSIPAVATIRRPVSFSVTPFDVWSQIGQVSWDFGDGAGADVPAVSHTFTQLGSRTVTVSAADVLGSAATMSATVTVFPGARAGHNAFVRGGKALLKIHCPSPAGCAGRARLITTASVRRGRHHAGRRVRIGAAAFSIAGQESTTVPVVLTVKGVALVRSAGREGVKAQLTGPGIKHRVVVLYGR